MMFGFGWKLTHVWIYFEVRENNGRGDERLYSHIRVFSTVEKAKQYEAWRHNQQGRIDQVQLDA